MEQSTLNDLLNSARQKAAAGDVERAAKFFEEAMWKAEQHGSQVYEPVLREAMEFYETERLDFRLINTVQRYMALVKPVWSEKDARYLIPLDHLCRAYYRTRAGKELEESIVKALEIERAVSGDRSAAYAKRLEYAANMLVDCGKRELAETLKGICHEIKHDLTKSPGPETVKLKPSGQLLVADRRVFLGLILTGSGVVPSAKFQENLQAAKQLGMHVGEVLISAGLLSHDQLYTALQLQSLVRGNKITMDKASQAFAEAVKQNMTLETVLAKFDLQKFLNDDSDRLGRILESAELISEHDLELALSESSRKKIPLARFLVTQRLVAPTIVAQALELQGYIRNGNVSRDAAIAKLKNAATAKKSGLQMRQGNLI